MTMECQQKNKVILFDFFGVISSEVSPVWFKRYFNEVEALEIKEEIMSKGDKGELNEEEIYGLIAKRVNETPLKVKEDFKELIHINYELVEYIKELKKERTIIYITHNLEEALMADKVIVMNKGEIVLNGTPKEIFANQEILRNASLDVLTSMKLINKIEENPLKIQKEIVDLLWQLTYEM